MNHEPDSILTDSLKSARLRVLAVHGTNYWPAILPEVIELSRTYERILERTWLHAYQCRWQQIVQNHQPGDDLEASELELQGQLNLLAAAFYEVSKR